MAYEFLSPGVQVNELDFSEYVSASANCIIGVVGGARRGPLVPTLVSNQEEFIKLFGKPSPDDYGAYSAIEALANASQLYYQRVCHNPVAATAGVAGVDKLGFTARKVGNISNGYTIDITVTSEDDFDIKVSKPDATKNDGTMTQLELFESLSIDPDADNFVSNKVNNESQYITVSLLSEGTLATKSFTMAGGEDGASFGTAGGSDKPFTIKTKYYDSTLNYCVVKFTKPDLAGYFDMIIYTEDRLEVVEHLKDLTLDPKDERFVELIVSNTSNQVEVIYNADWANGEGKGKSEDLSTLEYVIMGGSDGIKGLNESDIIGTVNDGLQAFSNPEVIDINVLCAPGWYQASVVNAGVQVCEGRGDAIFIADTPFGLTAQEANDWANGSGEFSTDHSAFNSSYGALYWPWIQVSDQFNHNKKIWLPPAGLVASQYAYNDRVGHTWFAPGGLNRGIITRALAVETSATKGERDLIYGSRNIVNPIINYHGKGITIFGQKTMLRKSSALDRVNVRRLLNYLKKVISASTSYYIFEQNDEISWNKWIDMVEPKLESVKQLRGIYEYYVKMKPTNEEIENNAMPGTVYVKPVKSTEYIPLNFMIMPYGASFDEDSLA